MGFTIASKFRKAISQDDIAALTQLVERHPKIDLDTYAVNMDGMTPLTFAIRHGHEKAAKTLLQLGASPNVPLGYGWTPMHKAAYYGRIGVVAEMLKHGGDPNLRNSDEQTVQALAERANRTDVVKLLQPYMKDPLSLVQGDLPQPLPKPVDAQTAGDTWSLLSEDTIAHVFAQGDTGYRMTEIFNFAAQERVRILTGIDSKQEHVDTRAFDTLAEEGLKKAFAALLAKGGKADENVLKRRHTQLDKPRPSRQQNAG